MGEQHGAGPARRAAADWTLLENPRWLQTHYVEQQLTLRQVGQLAGVSEQSVLRALRAQGIPTRKRGRVAGRGQLTGPVTDRDWLEEQYLRRNLSTTEIAALANVSEASVRRSLKRLGVASRPPRPPAGPPGALGDRRWVHQQYVERQQTLDQIAALAGVSRTTVHKALRQHGIAARRFPPERVPERVVYPELHQPGWLHEQHSVLGRTGAEIARMLGCTRGTVYRALQRLNNDEHSQRQDSEA